METGGSLSDGVGYTGSSRSDWVMKHWRRAAILTKALTLAASLAVGPATAGERWVEVKSKHFTVVSDESEAAARAAAHRFEEIRAVFQALSPSTSLTSGRPLTILALRDEDSMRRLLPGFWEAEGGARPIGLFLGDTPRVFALFRLDRAENGAGQSVVFHEYVHFLIGLNYDAIPLWLNEGLADFYASSATEGDRVLVGRPAPVSLKVLKQRPNLPLETLLAVDGDSPYYNEQERASIFYAQAWALVHYLLNDAGGAHRPQLAAYLKETAAGADPVEAGRRAFGDLEAFSRALEAYVHRSTFDALPLKATAVPAASRYTARTVAPAEVLALTGHVYLYTGRAAEAREAFEEASHLDPGLDAVWEGLAALALGDRHLDDAARAAEQAQRTGPSSFLAHFIAGGVAQARRDLPAAEKALERAVALNDAFVPAYVSLAAIRTVLRRPDDQVLPLVRRALQLEPGNAGTLLTLAAVLLDRGDLEGARQVGERALRSARTPRDRSAAERLLDELQRHGS
jgi:tetratricopeptide (TPR) repeat protein